ncbi:MAG: hypothetical protein IJ534_01065 [Bacteroidaceae bacterium]|nr:hypothetical protein [Bacteroidaceae bacterium]
MQREIGSNFWILPEDLDLVGTAVEPSQFGISGSDYVWLSTGRSAIQFVLREIEKQFPKSNKIAVLPPFTCHTVIEPFIKAGYRIEHYPIASDLNSNVEEILHTAFEVGAGIVLFHRYYGFDTLSGANVLSDLLRKNGIISIEDCTQCLYSGFPKSTADYHVGSIRKWTGVPDGGFAVCRKGHFSDKPKEPDLELETMKVKASISKYNYLFNDIGDKKAFLDQYRQAEDLLASRDNFFSISPVACQLQGNLDVKALIQKRRHNYRYLSYNINFAPTVQSVKKTLTESEVPLYYPILVKERKSLQTYLAERSIYAPVVWPKADCVGEVCSEADSLYSHLLCIPIDQRYDLDDMERICESINVFVEQIM